jgi:hypothetical protein
MRENGILLVAGSVFLVNAVVLAGCMQDKGGSIPAGDSQTLSPASTPPSYSGPRSQPNLTATV